MLSYNIIIVINTDFAFVTVFLWSDILIVIVDFFIVVIVYCIYGLVVST